MRTHKPARRLWALLRSQRGDADPVLMVVSMMVSLLIAGAMFGAIVLVMKVGNNFLVEQSRAATLSTAQKAWAQDANNASQVALVGQTAAVFYELPGRHPGVYMTRGDSVKVDQCRKSEWKLAAGVLTNTVTHYANVDCDLSNVAAATTGKASVIRLDGLDAGAKFVANNAAGRDLHFDSAGLEIGLKAGSAAPSTNTKAAWWHDTEWAYQQPQAVNMAANVDLPVSGTSPAPLLGSTWLRSTPGGTTLTTGEPLPGITPYDPAPPTIRSVTRSSTIGDIYNGNGAGDGGREGIRIVFDAASCGPYSTEYVVKWQPSTPGALVRERTFTTFTDPGPQDFDLVPNGSTGVASVTASCPTAVSTKPQTTSASYTQPLPAPALKGSIQAPPNVHTLDWSTDGGRGISSLPVVYRLEVNTGAGFTPQKVTAPNPTSAVVQTLTWPLGSTYGVPMDYRVIGILDTVTSKPSVDVVLQTAWPAVAAPTLAGTSAGLVRTETLTAVTCPAGTHPEYRQHAEFNNAGWETWSAWGAARTVQYTMLEGRQGEFAGQARCAYNATQYSPEVDSNTETFVQKITTKPAPPTITVTNHPLDTTPVDVNYPTTGCPTETAPQYRYRTLLDAGTWSGWSPWAASSTSPEAMWFGQQLQTQAEARCASPFTTGPSTPGSSTWVRPIPQAAAPSISHDQWGGSGPKDDRVIWTAITCPTMTSPRYEYAAGNSWSGSWTTATSQNVATAWGTAYAYSVHARCISNYAQSPSSSAPATSWITNVPTPNTPTVSVPSSAYKNSSFTVTVGGSNCPAGTATGYDVWTSGSSTHWSSSSFSDFWPSTGSRTYYAQIWCGGPNAAGARSGTGSDTISIVNPPAPAVPSGFYASATWYKFCGNSGFMGGVGWTKVAGATSYNVQADWSTQLGGRTGWRNVGSSTTTSLQVQVFDSVANSPNVQARVQAVGPGGSSGWAQWTVPLQPGCG